jgi:tRNA(fMet)-specific endonuclease VapC
MPLCHRQADQWQKLPRLYRAGPGADPQARVIIDNLGSHKGRANDLLIAAHELALGHTMVTDNEREFLRIDDLRVGNWLR